MIVICSGYFDPIHEGHIEYLEKSASLGKVYVIVNNDLQGEIKKGGCRIKERGRKEIIDSIKYVWKSMISIDTDRSVSKSIEKIVKENKGEEIIFTKGGDRFKSEIPEKGICNKLGVKIIDGLGEKINSSSKILGRKEE